MKKKLNYILFHIHTFQKKVGNEDVAPITISIMLSILVWFLINIINTILFVYFDYESMKLSKIYIILIMVVIFFPIFGYIRKKYYLEYNFKESIKGYLYFIFLIAFIVVTYVYFAKKSREKIMIIKGYNIEQVENESIKLFNPHEKPKSLEGEIRLWYYNTFREKDSLK